MEVFIGFLLGMLVVVLTLAVLVGVDSFRDYIKGIDQKSEQAYEIARMAMNKAAVLERANKKDEEAE